MVSFASRIGPSATALLIFLSAGGHHPWGRSLTWPSRVEVASQASSAASVRDMTNLAPLTSLGVPTRTRVWLTVSAAKEL